MTLLYVVPGDDRDLVVALTDPPVPPATTGTPTNLTGATALRFRVLGTDGSVLLTKNLGSGVTITDATNGLVTIILTAADTTSLPAGVLAYDLRLTDSASRSTTVDHGHLTQGYPLLTVPQFREHVKTNLPDAAVQRMIDANTLAIAERAGAIGSVSLTLTPARDRYLFLDRPVSAIASITEFYPDPVGISGVALDSTDYRILSGGTMLERWGYGTHPGDWWSERVELVYVPIDDSAERGRVLVKLCQLDLNREPGLSAIRMGEYQEQSRNEAYNDEREAILASLVPSVLTFA